LDASGLVYHTQTVQAAARRVLETRRPGSSLAVPNTLSVIASPAEDAPYRLSVIARESIYDDLPRQQIIHSVLGQPPDAAVAMITTQYDVPSVLVSLDPAWIPRLPWLPNRIIVRFPWEGR
jgi:hypothetical protein